MNTIYIHIYINKSAAFIHAFKFLRLMKMTAIVLFLSLLREQKKGNHLRSREKGVIRGNSSRVIILQSVETLHLRQDKGSFAL